MVWWCVVKLIELQRIVYSVTGRIPNILYTRNWYGSVCFSVALHSDLRIFMQVGNVKRCKRIPFFTLAASSDVFTLGALGSSAQVGEIFEGG